MWKPCWPARWATDTVEAALKDKILVIGENIKIRRFARYEGVCAAYIHAGGTHAVLVNFETSDEVAARLSLPLTARTSPCRSPPPTPAMCARAKFPLP